MQESREQVQNAFETASTTCINFCDLFFWHIRSSLLQEAQGAMLLKISMEGRHQVGFVCLVSLILIGFYGPLYERWSVKVFDKAVYIKERVHAHGTINQSNTGPTYRAT